MEVYASDITGANTTKSNHAYMTFVALDSNSLKPKKVPVLLPVSSEEQRLFKSAIRRRELRLILSGRLKAKDAIDLRAYFDDLD